MTTTYDLTRLRATLAEKMGWKCFPFVVINGTLRAVQTWIAPIYVAGFDPEKPHAGCCAGQLPPNYPASLDALVPVVERLAEMGYSDFTCISDGKEWTAVFDNKNIAPTLPKFVAPTQALAVTLAALEALGVDTEEFRI